MDIKYYLKVYSKDHELLDEIYLLSNIKYTKTLNGIGKLEFNTPIKYLAQKGLELTLGQHIELYNDKEELMWYGVINSPCPNGVDINVLCLGYACLLQNRSFTNIELNSDNEWSKIYNNKRYGELIFSLINEINGIAETGIKIGILNDTDLKTDRIINWDDDLYDKIQEFIEDSNCYFFIDKDRYFNFYDSIGEDKSDYYEINDYNIIDSWDYAIDQTQIANVINARVVWEDEGVTTALVSEVMDEDSIRTYGRREKALSVNDIRLQETLDKQCLTELNTYKNPLINCSARVGISDTFNIFDIKVGDYIKLNSEKYRLNIKIRVLEYTVDLITNTVEIALGNAIFRENKPKIYRY